MYLVIALFHSGGTVAVAPVFTTAKNLSRAVAIARETRLFGYDLIHKNTGVYIFRVRMGTLYKSWDFWYTGEPLPDYPCICRLYLRGKKLTEEWNDKRAARRFALTAPKKRGARRMKRKK